MHLILKFCVRQEIDGPSLTGVYAAQLIFHKYTLHRKSSWPSKCEDSFSLVSYDMKSHQNAQKGMQPLICF